MGSDLGLNIADLKRDEVKEQVTRRAGAGENPATILDECRIGMAVVGERFQKGDYYLAELILSAEIFKGAAAILEPYLAKQQPTNSIGKVMLVTMRGDIHDLGKNILASLLKAQAFEVIDLGADVSPSVVIDAVKENKPDFLGFSALITTAYASMKEASDMLTETGLRGSLKLMVGGGVTTPMVRDYIGADFQTIDAMEGVTYCQSVVGVK